MAERTISASAFKAKCLGLFDEVAQTGETIVVTKRGRPVARLVPDNEKVCKGRELAELLAKVELPEAEAAAWHRDLRAGRKTLRTPVDKWR